MIKKLYIVIFSFIFLALLMLVGNCLYIESIESNQEKICQALKDNNHSAILTLLKEYKIQISGKHIVVIGRSLLVGRSIANLMLNNDVTVTVCHSKTKNLKKITNEADIIISAVGKPNFIKKDFVRKKQIVKI